MRRRLRAAVTARNEGRKQRGYPSVHRRPCLGRGRSRGGCSRAHVVERRGHLGVPLPRSRGRQRRVRRADERGLAARSTSAPGHCRAARRRPAPLRHARRSRPASRCRPASTTCSRTTTPPDRTPAACPAIAPTQPAHRRRRCPHRRRQRHGDRRRQRDPDGRLGVPRRQRHQRHADDERRPVLRAQVGGTQDTNDNATDFTGPKVGNPQNHAGADAAPSVTSRSPGIDATDVATAANVSVTFSEPVNVTGSWYSISCATSGSPHRGGERRADDLHARSRRRLRGRRELHGDDRRGAGLRPGHDRPAGPPGRRHRLELHDRRARDADADPRHPGRGAHLALRTGSWSERARGSSPRRPRTASGCRTRTPTPTRRPPRASSSSPPPPRRSASATRCSRERHACRSSGPAASSNGNLTTTELASPTVSVLSTGNPLPAPTVIGTGGRIPPDTVIEDDATGNVETSGVFDPDQDGARLLREPRGDARPAEQRGRRRPDRDRLRRDAGDRRRRRERVRPHLPRRHRCCGANDGNPERITLDDQLAPLPNVNVGDHYSGPIVGVMDYNFGNPFLEVTTTGLTAIARRRDAARRPTRSPPASSRSRPSTSRTSPPTNPQSKFDGLASADRQQPALARPDRRRGGAGQQRRHRQRRRRRERDAARGSSTRSRPPAGRPTRGGEIDPVNDQDGGEPGGNIRQVFLFRTDRGLAFVDRPGGTLDQRRTRSSAPGGHAAALQPRPHRRRPTRPGAQSASRWPASSPTAATSCS